MEIGKKHIDIDITKGRYNKRFIHLLISLLTFLFGALFIPASYSHYISPLFMLQFTFAGLILFRNHRRAIYRLIIALIVLVLIFEAVKLLPVSLRVSTAISNLTYLIYFTVMTVEVFRQILLARRIDLNMVAGSFSGFIMLAMLCSFMLSIVEMANPGSFTNIRNDSFESMFQDLVYYSFVSILTIGYGDIIPTTPIARRASLLLGIVGYFYNIFVIGITISKFLMQSKLEEK